ncbi:TOMM precursor leader peptide-binding protein [Streptomyces sp. NRRL F-5135]|uniref:TOMM precursor leader peptide-binding protein n=1 Tax=Streptomyces sp. NRRL F-5135 TaxID=1463858 RepID=UPI0004CC75E3|nr:TOMM precursor leader peptide-binding protein [Streptomyces sp. NRRL F-5135]
MRPTVKPALRRAWRERQTVQFGVTPAHAVTVGPVDTATGSFLQLLDGTRGLPLLREEARAMGLPESVADELVRRLTAAGLIDDPGGGGPAAEALRERPADLERLRPDLASLSVLDREPGAGMRRLGARRSLRVQVRGAGRVGAALAAVLSASGVGRVDVLDGGHAQAWDVSPGGLPQRSVGERRDAAARRLVRHSAPGPAPRTAADRARRAEPPGEGEPPLSLVILAPRDGFAAYVPDPAAAEPWVSAGTPHLYAGVIEATGVVGPLVLPGGTACAGCLAGTRADRDPGWPRMLAQWRSGHGPATVPACDLGLATTVAGLAAAHALSFLDGELPASTGARWEASLPLLDWRAERLAPHPDCPCGAAGRPGRERLGATGATQDTMAG